jgi:preprotein translocase subunit SecA
MRIFATGAMNWVMGKALPEDVPIEAKMVTRAIEKAQSTVEARNGEFRKDTLKYDEVMNEQRKVIYQRRMQVIDGEDLKERTEQLIEGTIERVVTAACPSDYQEEWDLEQLVTEVTQYYPTKFTVDDLEQASDREHLTDSVMAEALGYYDAREAEFPGGEEMARDIERQVMLQIIDQRWRDHLAEMDYLKEGIGLRGLAQQDPLVAWQREGYAMFGQLLDAIDDDYLRYVLHVQVITEPAGEPDLSEATYEAADEPVQDSSVAFEAAREAEARAGGEDGRPAGGGVPRAPAGAPRSAADGPRATGAARSTGGAGGGAAAGDGAVRTAGNGAANGARAGARATARTSGDQPAASGVPRKVGRNDPCWCGSGRKFKLCHGAV